MGPRRRKCTICHSRKWHKESSGLIVCSEGHVLQSYVNENHETTEMGPHAVRKRRLKSQRQKKDQEDMSKANLNLYHGLRARYHYFQCQQLILRMQIASLAELWSLPLPELEVTCRDLWSYHLEFLPNPPPSEPYVQAQEEAEREEGISSLNEPHLVSSLEDDDKEDDKDDYDDEKELDPGEEEDSALADLLQEASDSSSEDDNNFDQFKGDNAEGEDTPAAKKRKRRKDRNHYEHPAANIAILVLACWVLRIPIIYTDIIKLIESYQLPYLETIRLLPSEMTRPLNKYTTRNLSPNFSPNTLFLHTIASRLAQLMHSKHGVLVPELNTAPILHRAIRSLLCPPIVYTFTKTICTLLDIPLTLHPSLSPELSLQYSESSKQKTYYRPKSHKRDNIPPELALVSGAVIALKLLFGGLENVETRVNGFPSGKEYIALLQGFWDARASSTDELFSPASDLLATDMTDEQIKEYLGFCERALLLPKEAEQERRDENMSAIAHLFPLGRNPEPLQSNNPLPESSNPPLTDTDTALLPPPSAFSLTTLPKVSPESESAHPLGYYSIYASADVAGTFPMPYALVLDVAARWVGVSRETVAGVVEQFERRLVAWDTRESRDARMREKEKRKAAST